MYFFGLPVASSLSMLVGDIFLKRNLSINQCLTRVFCFHYYIEFLIFFEFIRRFLQILQCRLFNNNSRKSGKIFVNNEEPE